MKTEEQIANLVNGHALDQFLTEYPDDMSYEDVILALRSDDAWALLDKGILIWSKFEDESAPEVADHIGNARWALNELVESILE